MRRAYEEIFNQLREAMTPYTLLVYESLVAHPEHTQGQLLQSLGLKSGSGSMVQIYDGNQRYRQLRQA
jgi:hypothetical protein